jgi:hypothetical protein
MAKRLTGNENGPNYLGAAEVQAVASSFAQIIFGMVDMLALCHSGLGMPPDANPLREENAALREQLRGDIEILVNETLPAATKILGEMAFETEDSLSNRWRQVLERRIKTQNSGDGGD